MSTDPTKATTAENKQGGRLSANPLSGRSREAHIVETDDARNTSTTEHGGPEPQKLATSTLQEWEQATPVERKGMTWPIEVLRAIGRNV